ncbi:MAG: hypothetical protein QXK06_02805 [Candidatus Diapherotrites archaeon]
MFFFLKLQIGVILKHPESELVRKSFTFRRMDLPPQVFLTKKSLLRWLCLSLGLMSENESRSTVVEILDAFFFFVFSKKEKPSSQQIKAFLEKNRGISVSEKLVRYHLNRLCDLGFVVHEKGFYSLNPAPDAERDDLPAAFRHWYRREIEDSTQIMEKALAKVQAAYEK